jgi:DNA-binding transcriptional regulator GbsR (MarR family)
MTTPRSKPSLTSAQDRFIATWGQMGSTWGISRTMAEVHALLFISGRALCTDDVMERLEISRGNASMSLRALVDWGVVHRAHKRGDRKEYFEAAGDVWTMLQAILRERMKREIHPALASLAEIRDETRSTGEGVDEHNQRLDDMIALLRLFDEMGSKLLALDAQVMKETAETLVGGMDFQSGSPAS